MNIKCVIFLLFITFSHWVQGFEKIEIKYSYNPAINKDVTIAFDGFYPKNPINTLAGTPPQLTPEVKKVMAYFKKMHHVNANGTKQDALNLWEKELRKELDADFSDEYFQANQSQFKKTVGVNLHLIIDYDGVLICFISYDSDGKDDDWIIPNQLILEDGEYKMTNRLNNDYFFKHIASLILKNNNQLADELLKKQK